MSHLPPTEPETGDPYSKHLMTAWCILAIGAAAAVIIALWAGGVL